MDQAAVAPQRTRADEEQGLEEQGLLTNGNAAQRSDEPQAEAGRAHGEAYSSFKGAEGPERN